MLLRSRLIRVTVTFRLMIGEENGRLVRPHQEVYIWEWPFSAAPTSTERIKKEPTMTPLLLV